MEMVFANCVGVKRQNDESSSVSPGHGKRSRPCSENVDIRDVLASFEAQLDAFACPGGRNEETESDEFLTTTKRVLDAAKLYCGKLQDELRGKEQYYLLREKQLEEFYRSELEREKEILARNQYCAHEQSFELAAAKDKEIAEKNQELCAVEQREFRLKEEVWTLHIAEEELHNKLKRAENSFAILLKVARKREKQWQVLKKLYTNGVKSLRASENRERELRETLSLARDGRSVSRESNSSSGASITSELSGLKNEVDCLRRLLEIRQYRMSKLMKRSRKLMEHAEKNAVLTETISKLESRQKMLKSELAIKRKKEKDLLRRIKNMEAAYKHEKEQRNHLSFENETLQYQLNQRSEEWQAAMNTTMGWVETSTLRSERYEELAVTVNLTIPLLDLQPQESPLTQH